MTPEQHREHAVRIMTSQARHAYPLTIAERVETATDDDVDAIMALLETATVAITWPDENALTCKAQYEREGGRQHGDRIVRCARPAGHTGDHREYATCSTWAIATISTATGGLTTRIMTFGSSDLTPEQEIRLRHPEAFIAASRVMPTTRDLDDIDKTAAHVEQGHDDLEDACTERCPNAEDADLRREWREHMRRQLAEALDRAALAQAQLERVEQARSRFDAAASRGPNSEFATLDARWVNDVLSKALDYVPEPDETPERPLATGGAVENDPALYVGERGPEDYAPESNGEVRP